MLSMRLNGFLSCMSFVLLTQVSCGSEGAKKSDLNRSQEDSNQFDMNSEPKITDSMELGLGSDSHYLYFMSNGSDSLPTNVTVEGYNAGYKLYGFISVKNNWAPGRVPLNRCLVIGSGKHFLSATPDCEGQKLEGNLGFLNGATESANDQLWRCRHAGNGGYLFTRFTIDCHMRGYVVEGKLASLK